MKSADEKPLDEVIAGSNPLAALLRANRLFAALDAHVRPALSESCRDHVRVACVRDEILVLAADSAAWGARARLEAPGALASAQQVWPKPIRQVQVIVSAWTGEQPD